MLYSSCRKEVSMSYTTGEIAKLCGVSVRTVQFYDSKGLLKPESLSEGGRRLYDENGLKTLQTICMYKSLGLSLTEIGNLLSDGADADGSLLNVLSVKEIALKNELEENKVRLDGIRALKKHISEGRAIPAEKFYDIRTVMEKNRKLRLLYATMGAIAVISVIAEISFIVLWAVLGIWLPFAIGMPCVCVSMAVLTAMYYKNVSFVCRECGKEFKPGLVKVFFAPHTPRTRRFKCPHCGCKRYHYETFGDI